MNKSGVRHGKVLTLPIVTRELRDLRCCDGDAVTLKCKVTATPEPPLVRWERGGKILSMGGDFSAEFDGEAARLCIQHVYPEDEGEYTCVAYNDLGKAFTSACIVVDVPEGKENLVSQRLTRPISLISAGSTPRSTPRSTPIRSLSPAISHGRELRSPQLLPRGTASKRPKICAPKFYAVPHNRVVEEGETVHFQCAAIGHPLPWVKWDKNGCTVTPSNRISVKERDDVKILEISEVTQEDAGLYRVTVENDFGRIEASARLEIINRYRSLSRTIRTRSASPRTYPSFDRSLLNTTTRINGHLQLGCTFTGNPSPTPTWYRNGRPLERSSRIKRYFDGKTMKIEISKVKASDGGEYTCVAKNVLGSTRNTCEVTVLDPHDPSTADKDPPKFLQPLPKDSVVMEEYCYELQARLTGTPPFSVTWLKNGREVSENDHRRFVIYGDGGIALRLSNVCPQDAGEYTCRVCNNFGQISCTGLFAVQDYKNASTLPPQFTKTPLSVITAKGDTACFCARVQCGKPMEIAWSINGKDVKDNIKCKVENNGDTSILRIQNVTSRDMGIIRCTASVIENGLSISCMAELRLQESFQKCLSNHANTQANSNKQKTKTSSNRVEFEKNINVSSSPYCRRFNESQMHTRSSSLPRRSNLKLQNLSAIPKRCISKSPINRKKSNTLSTNRFTKQDLDNAKEDKETTGSNLVEEVSMKDYENLLLSNKEEMRNALFSLETENDVTIDENLVYNNELALPVFSKTEKDSPTIEEHDDHKEALTASISRASRTEENEENCTVSTSENEHPMQLPVKKSDGKEFVGATVTKVPADITVFRGNRVILRVNYEGHPQPNIKWFRAGREVRPDEDIAITNGEGVSCLILDNMTADHAGKYEVFVENSAGRDHRFFSVAVEGSPDPPAGIPNVSCSARTTTITWRSPPYDGGCTVTGYTVEMNRVGESTWSTVTESCHSLSHDIPNHELLGDSYRFRIRAENIHGLSEASAESNIVKIPEGGETVIRDKEDGFEAPFEAHLVDIEDGRLFGERYEVFEELGKGRYGIVRRVIEKTKDVSFAAKFVRTIKAKDREQVREEIKIMNMLRHPKLLLLAAAFESPREIVMVTEYISGGELFERVVADDFTLTERDGILFMRQICEGVEYMHKNNVVHLDLKPENIMCRTRTSHQIKLIDFGLAQTLKPDTPIRVLFGTPEFIPPEIISYEPIGTESDMWSVGVICYVLLTGLSPFMGDNDAETFANITRADYDLEDEAFDAISNNAKDFISGLLVKRKELRMSARQCLEHPWMAQHAEAMSRVALSTDKLKKFIVRRKWQKTGNAIRALGRMAILSANSRRPTTSAESSPTSDPRTNPIESQSFLKSLQDGEKSSNVEANYTDEHRENFTKLNSRENNVYAFCYKTEVIIPSEEPTESIRNDEQSSSSCLISVSKEESTKNDISALIADNNRPLVDEETETNQNPRNIFDENRQKLEPGNELQLNTLDPYTKNEDEPTKITNIQIQESLITENISFSADEIEILQMNLESKTVLTSSTEEDSNMQKSEIASRSKNVAEEIVSELHYEDLKNTDEEHNSDFNANTVVGNDNEEFQTELEPKTISKPQSQRRMFRGDSRDSGIGDCNSSLATSSQQLDQLGIVSIIEEEIDNDVHNEEKCEQADLTTGLERKMKILEVELENTKASMKERKGSTKLAVQSDLIKTSCMTNQQCEDVVESEDPRVISRIRNKFVPTGNVSRTAKLFEKEKASTWSQINTVQSTAVQRTYPAAAVVATKPHNERIQKAFAFWNK